MIADFLAFDQRISANLSDILNLFRSQFDIITLTKRSVRFYAQIFNAYHNDSDPRNPSDRMPDLLLWGFLDHVGTSSCRAFFKFTTQTRFCRQTAPESESKYQSIISGSTTELASRSITKSVWRPDFRHWDNVLRWFRYFLPDGLFWGNLPECDRA